MGAREGRYGIFAPVSSDQGAPSSRESADREHFDRIAASYTRKDESRSSRVARRHRLVATLDAIDAPPLPNVLEVGCGAGYAVEYTPFEFGRYVGIDHSQELVSVAADRHGKPGVEFHAGRVQDLAEPGSFDVVFVIGVLHHLEDVGTALERMVAALRPGGWLVVNEPQPGNPVVSAARRVRKRVDKTYSADQVEFRSNELVSMFQAAGLDAVDVRPQGYLSTPFAEVPLPLGAVTSLVARAAVRSDRAIERRRLAARLAWNCIARGRRPMSP